MSTSRAESTASDSKRREEFWALARRIAHLGTQGVGRLEFLRELSAELLAISGCRVVHIWMTDVEGDYHWQMNAGRPPTTHFEVFRSNDEAAGNVVVGGDLSHRIRDFMNRLHGSKRGSTLAHKPYHVHNEATRRLFYKAIDADQQFAKVLHPHDDAEMLLLPLQESQSLTGLVVLSAELSRQFFGRDCFLYEQVMETTGRAVINRRAQFRLRERIKELTCLHGIAKVVQQYGDSSEAAIQAIIDILPAAMQFPAITDARLSLDDRVYATRPIGESAHRLAVPIIVGGRSRGVIEVSYRESHPEFTGSPFLHEERELLNSVAHEIGMFVERSESAAAKAVLAEQLRHADRLATIGQLAAGVAHELNEPLGNIMGFAQLLQKQIGLPEGAHRDAEQIVRAAIHGREIVKKLLVFSRQSDSQRVRLDLSRLIRDNLYFLEARCRHNQIDLRLELMDGQTWIVGVPSELTQVLVNLAVNAIQAMPGGGVLTVRTRSEAESVYLTVDDTGQGMDEKTQQRLFTPFFTTKDIGEGTGLGLSVVLGIVSAHGGKIHVESAPGRGSRFEVVLPGANSTAPSTPRVQ